MGRAVGDWRAPPSSRCYAPPATSSARRLPDPPQQEHPETCFEPGLRYRCPDELLFSTDGQEDWGRLRGGTMVYPEEKRIGRFEKCRAIGRGGFGVVYRAVDPRIAAEIALKVIDLQFNNDLEALAAERRGAAIQEQLSRAVPEIARVHEFFEDEQHFYVVMEFVRGDDLSKLLEQGPLAERRAVSIGIQLCRILEACSRIPIDGAGRDNRLVHCDIKPRKSASRSGSRPPPGLRGRQEPVDHPRVHSQRVRQRVLHGAGTPSRATGRHPVRPLVPGRRPLPDGRGARSLSKPIRSKRSRDA